LGDKKVKSGMRKDSELYIYLDFDMAINGKPFKIK
jgi:hypothetical protein